MDVPDTTGKNGADGVEKRPVRGGIAGRKDYARDKLTNGSKTLPDTDGRLRVARRFRDIAAAILVDQGGFDACSESRRQLQAPRKAATTDNAVPVPSMSMAAASLPA